MAPRLTEEEIDDLLYAARTNETEDLIALISAIAEREKVSTAEILIATEDEAKSTCLHKASGNGHLEMVRCLVDQFSSRPEDERQSFLDAPNEYGNTGLHWAALGGHLMTVKFLMEVGASPGLANEKNYVPLDLASFGEKIDVVDYFLSKSEATEGGEEGVLAGEFAKLELEREADAAAESETTA